MRDEKDGGPSRVLRCKTRLGTALVGVKSVDFAPSLSLFYLLLLPLGAKDMQILAQYHRNHQRMYFLKCQQRDRKVYLHCS